MNTLRILGVWMVMGFFIVACSDDSDPPARDLEVIDQTIVSDAAVDSMLDTQADQSEQDQSLIDQTITDQDVTDDSGLNDQTQAGDQAITTNAIIITEIMANPDVVYDSDAEWFELYNPGTTDIDINGWTFKDLDLSNPNTFTIAQSLIIPAKGYIVLGPVADTTLNGDVILDYVYGKNTFYLSNKEDEIAIYDDQNNLVDIVEWKSDWNIPVGASIALTDENLDNNISGSWCKSGETWSSSTANLGSPKAQNVCASPGNDAGTGNDYGHKDAGVTVDNGVVLDIPNYDIQNYDFANVDIPNYDYTYTDLPNYDAGMDVPVVNDGAIVFDIPNIDAPSNPPTVVISELMINPNVIADSDGEYIELFNATSGTVDLSGWTIKGGNNSHVITSLSMAPLSYVVLVRTANALIPGNTYVYGTGSNSDPYLGNTSATVTLSNTAGQVVDSVTTSSSWASYAAGASMSFKLPYSADNALEANWCQETTVISPTNSNLGSPNSAPKCQ